MPKSPSLHDLPRRFGRICLFIAIGLVACNDVVEPPVAVVGHSQESLVPSDSTQIAAGGRFTCWLRGGVVRCQGLIDIGADDGVREAAVGSYVQLEAGYRHACALRTDGVAECWGSPRGSALVPVLVATTGSLTYVSAGFDHTCAIRTDGVAECWGGNDAQYGQMPPIVAPNTGVFIQLASDYAETCGLRSDGVVECFGLGFKNVHNATTGTFTQITDECGLRSDGIIECWDTDQTHSASVGTFIQFAAGPDHGCGLRDDGVVECWGLNNYGQSPAEVVAMFGKFMRITANGHSGVGHSCAVRSEDSFQCWGFNQHHQADSETPNYDPEAQTLEFTSTPPTPAFAGADYIVAAAASSGMPVTFSSLTMTVCTTAADTVRLIAAGTCTVAAESGDDISYEHVEETQSFAVDTVTPAAPSSLVATVIAPERIDLAWNDGSTNETTFELLRRAITSTLAPYQVIARLPTNVEAFADETVQSGMTYQYRIRACAGPCSTFAQSRRVTTPATIPATPGRLHAKAISPTEIELRWGDLSDDEERFELQRRIRNPDGNWTTIVNAAPGATKYTDATVDPGTTYQYRIRACNVAGCSSRRASADITTPSVPIRPSDLSGTPNRVDDQMGIDLTWTDASANESTFVLTRRMNDTGTWGQWNPLTLPGANSVSYRDTGVDAGVTYQYRIRACNTYGCSVWRTSAEIAIP